MDVEVLLGTEKTCRPNKHIGGNFFQKENKREGTK